MAKILIIEDEAILRGEVMEWLTFEDYEAIGAADGLAGVELAFHELPDLVICDITMPLLDGYGVLLELRANPATANIPFIFVTARVAHEDMRQGMSLGADDYITKPFTRLELLQAIHSRLQKRAIFQETYQQEIEQWQQAFQDEREQRIFKAKLVAMFSHDFRNPLTSIISSNSILRDYADRLDAQKRLNHHNRIDASVRRLLQMLDDMLLIAQMETGNLVFQPESVNVEEFYQSIITEFQSIHQETHRVIFENLYPHAIQADPRLLQQITTNLISNAIKYSPVGGEVYVKTDNNNGHFILTVEDHGMGIPQTDQQKIFNEFQRASNIGNIPGTGLGLAIVKQAVTLHSGSISLESQENIGTKITIQLPILTKVK